MENQTQHHNLLLKVECVLASLFKKGWMIITIIIICGIGFDVFKTLTYSPKYVSNMQAALKLEQNTYSQLENAQSYVKTLDYIFNGQVVKDYIKDQMQVDDVNYTCVVVSQNNTNIVNVQVSAPTKREAYYALEYLTNWYVANATNYHLEYELDILEKGQLNEVPAILNVHSNNFKKGAMIGIGIVAIMAICIYLKPTVKVADEIEKQVDCRLFAKIPKEKKGHGRRRKEAILITSLKTSFAYKEAIKKLRNRVETSAKKHQYQTFMITSSVENEGKSSIAANLALSLSKNDHHVLLIDADLKKPSLHKIFSLNNERCLNNYLNGRQSWQDQVTYLEKSNLFVISSLQDVVNSEDLLQARLETLINEAKKEFDFIIVDTTPAYGISEPAIINQWVDASLLVIKQNEASITTINETISRIVAAKNNLIGCIFNASVTDFTKNQKLYGYRYGYNRYNRR